MRPYTNPLIRRKQKPSNIRVINRLSVAPATAVPPEAPDEELLEELLRPPELELLDELDEDELELLLELLPSTSLTVISALPAL